jgi:hypothetical protein
VDGKASVALNARVAHLLSVKANSPEYYISITPYSGCGTIQIDKKNEGGFTVIEVPAAASTTSSNSAHTFEYVIFVKQSINIANANKTSQ